MKNKYNQKAKEVNGDMNQNCNITNVYINSNNLDLLNTLLNNDNKKNIEKIIQKGNLWQVNFSHPYYINVPRLMMLAAMYGESIYLSNYNENTCLFSMGYSLNYLMVEMKKYIEKLKFNSVSLEEDISNLQVGQTIEFSKNFRTKNVPQPSSVENGEFNMVGDLQSDPHLYVRMSNYKIILTIDPKWITTCTSFCNLSSGWVNIAGLGMVKQIMEDQIIITPYIFGIPKNSLMDELFGK